MAFTALSGALASKSYDQIADICDNLMLQLSSQGVAFKEDWPYAIHLLGHIYGVCFKILGLEFEACSTVMYYWFRFSNSARYLWKMIPLAVRDSQPEVSAVWKIGQRLWTRDYVGVHEAIREFNWSPDTQSFVAAFSGEL
ncbi:hypothetical protein F511_01590 [Dorcoceras hygrometricum]|nr:hypothetical protein F511_01590 [Dorcoceras hygrometricum]